MTPPSRTKAALFIATVFIAGSAIGGWVGYSSGKQRWTKPPGREEMARRIMDGLKKDLQLSNQQVGFIEPILRETGDRIWEIHTTTTDRVRNLIKESDARISQHLSAEQNAKFEEISRKRWEAHDKRSKSSRQDQESRSGDKSCKTNRNGAASSEERFSPTTLRE